MRICFYGMVIFHLFLCKNLNRPDVLISSNFASSKSVRNQIRASYLTFSVNGSQWNVHKESKQITNL